MKNSSCLMQNSELSIDRELCTSCWNGPILKRNHKIDPRPVEWTSIPQHSFMISNAKSIILIYKIHHLFLYCSDDFPPRGSLAERLLVVTGSSAAYVLPTDLIMMVSFIYRNERPLMDDHWWTTIDGRPLMDDHWWKTDHLCDRSRRCCQHRRC